MVRSDEYSRAILVAEAKLTEITASPLTLGTQSGEANNFTWNSIISLYVDPAAAENPLDPNLALELYKIQVEVGWGKEGKPRSVILNSLRLSPKK